MNETRQNSTQKRLITPLWIIALFISLTETVLGVGVIQTSDGVQAALTGFFVMSFPVLVAGAFFFTLWKKPWILYAPTEYGSGTDVEVFVREMSDRAKSLDELQLFPQIQQTIREIFTEVITEISNIDSHQGSPSLKEIGRVLDKAAVKAEERIREQGFLAIDTRPFEGENGHVWQVAYDRYSTVSELLDDIFFSFGGNIPSMSFGRLWILRDGASRRLFTDMGRRWAERRHGKELDERTLAQVGIELGMVLEVVPVGYQARKQ